jgi:DNA-binding protein HU-beta
MSKTDLVNYVAGQTGLTKADSKKAVDAVFDGIVAELRRSGSISISTFGTFSVKDVPAGERRNPRTGESVQVDAHKKPHFKPSTTLKGALN